MSNPWKKEVIIGDCRLLLGDCLSILPHLPKVDAVITDPPYGIGIAANPVRQKHEKLAWDDAAADGRAMTALLAAGNIQIIWGGNYFPLPPTQGFLVWDKVQPEGLTLSMCEYAWTSMSKPAKIFKRHVVSYEKRHPTAKPVELMRWCLERADMPNSVIDPYMGSGTTGVACAELGKKFTGIELHEPYFDIACERITNAYRQERMFP